MLGRSKRPISKTKNVLECKSMLKVGLDTLIPEKRERAIFANKTIIL
jgi:hypothetical protein